MKRLKLELKQTMDMYSSACKEAISAKKKVAFFFFFLTSSAGGVSEPSSLHGRDWVMPQSHKALGEDDVILSLFSLRKNSNSCVI